MLKLDETQQVMCHLEDAGEIKLGFDKRQA